MHGSSVFYGHNSFFVYTFLFSCLRHLWSLLVFLGSDMMVHLGRCYLIPGAQDAHFQDRASGSALERAKTGAYLDDYLISPQPVEADRYYDRQDGILQIWHYGVGA